MAGLLRSINSNNIYSNLDDTVHEVLPLAKEYAATKTLYKADKFLAEKCRMMGSKISSDQIVKNIFQAGLYNLTTYLEECVTIASRKRFKNLTKIQQFNDILQETRLKIRMKRWNDRDAAIEATEKMTEITPTEDFYLPYRPLPVVAPVQGQFGTPAQGQFGKSTGGGLFGAVATPLNDFTKTLKPFMNNN